MTEMGRETLERKGQEVGNEIRLLLSRMCLLINQMWLWLSRASEGRELGLWEAVAASSGMWV